MAILEITGIELYAYHGCFEEEQIIGQYYMVDITIDVDIDEACKTDDLSKTIDYASIYEITKTEMAVKSKLIENVAYRIKKAIQGSFPIITNLKVSVSKPNPPVAGEIKHTTITV